MSAKAWQRHAHPPITPPGVLLMAANGMEVDPQWVDLPSEEIDALIKEGKATARRVEAAWKAIEGGGYQTAHCPREGEDI